VTSPQVGTARAGPRPLVVSPGYCPPSSLLLAPWVFWQNRIFAIFSGIFPESRISPQKRDTRAILLKTALVCVSCIQNTQIKGETIAKVFGKVDMFWTYHTRTPGDTPLGCIQVAWMRRLRHLRKHTKHTTIFTLVQAARGDLA
jgi:hypothetical protein